MKKILFLTIIFSFLSNIQSALGMIRQVDLDENLKKQLKQFHQDTGSSGRSRPNLDEFRKPNRLFIAKMDSFGLDRYYLFTNNDHINQLVEAVQNGGGMGLSWFSYDLSENEESLLMHTPGSHKSTLIIHALLAKKQEDGKCDE